MGGDVCKRAISSSDIEFIFVMNDAFAFEAERTANACWASLEGNYKNGRGSGSDGCGGEERMRV
jgi:hypothetical protein